MYGLLLDHLRDTIVPNNRIPKVLILLLIGSFFLSEEYELRVIWLIEMMLTWVGQRRNC